MRECKNQDRTNDTKTMSDNEFAKVFKRKKMIRITRFRLGSEMREGRYWEGEEKRTSKLCG